MKTGSFYLSVFFPNSSQLTNILVVMKRIWILLFLITTQLLFFSSNAFGQQRTITGIVTDAQTGETLPGVNVYVKGTTIGTSTDLNGNYSLNVDENVVLCFSFIGYITAEVPVAGKTQVNVSLNRSVSAIDEVIVTGYASQRKVDVIGSITTVKAEKLTAVPVPTLVQSMMGKTPGMFMKIQSAQPGDLSGLKFNIRGFGKALIIIDGMPASDEEFLLLDPNDIKELNVLKDAATAAVYGARAGNGVVLITTKRGRAQDAKFTYSGNFSLQKLTMIPHAVNSWQNAQFENIARENVGLEPLWTLEEIDKFKANDDPWNYPNTDWWKATLRQFAPQTIHNLNVNGGTERFKYFVSGGYTYQESLYRSNSLKNKKYNLRTNLDIALTDKLDFGIDLAFLIHDNFGPASEFGRKIEPESSAMSIMMMLYRSRPQYPLEYPDPTKYAAMGNDDVNPVTATRPECVGYRKWDAFTGDSKFRFEYELPAGFKAKALFNYKRKMRADKRHEYLAPAYWFDYDEEGNIQYHNHRNYNKYNWIKEDRTTSQVSNQSYILSWAGKFGDHKINALAAYERLSSEGQLLSASRIRYEYDIDYLFAGPDRDKNNNGTAWQDGRISQILSVDYNFQEKYLFGFKARRDGSPRFPPKTRWGIFPSVSAGWRISQEDFISENAPVISNLKLRASWGNLGYDETGDYQYLSTFSIIPASYMADGIVYSSIRADAIPNLNITWEKITTSNIGLDFGLFEGTIEGSFDFFYRKRSDVLGNRLVSLPDVVGASMPQENLEEYSNRGFEITLNYMKQFGNFLFSTGGNVSFQRERIDYVDQPEYASEEARRRYNKIGTWSDTHWGYLADGLFTSQEEIDNWAILDGKGNATVRPGDIKNIDYNGDGVVNKDDYVIIGRGTTPDLMFNWNVDFAWKGFEFNMLWQGAGMFDIWLANPYNSNYRNPFHGGNAPTLEMYKYSYTPENKWGMPANLDPNALFPRYTWSGKTHNENGNSSFWYHDGTYVRLKTIDLAYNLPKKMMNKIGIENLKVIVSAYNLITIAKLRFIDPEMGSEHTHGEFDPEVYPSTANYNIGVVLKF